MMATPHVTPGAMHPQTFSFLTTNGFTRASDRCQGLYCFSVNRICGTWSLQAGGRLPSPESL